MSKCTQRTLTCRKCHKEFEATIWESVNVSLDPELREKFIFDQLYVFKCPHCGEIHYIPYPILYHDMEHKFMVQSGTLEDVYNFWKMDLTMNGMLDGDKNPLKEIMRTGANSPMLAREKVVALENGLDHRLATIYRCIVQHQYNQYAEKNDLPQAEDSYLCYDDDWNMAVIIDYLEKDTNKPNAICQKFDRELYDDIAKNLGKYLKGSCEFLFDDFAAYKVLEADDESYKYRCLFKPEIALVKQTDGRVNFVKVPTLHKGMLSVGDLVILQTPNDWTFKGKILAIINDLSEYACPIDLSECLQVMKKVEDKTLATTCDSDEELDNQELLEDLIKYDEEKQRLPYELIRESDVILGMATYIGGEVQVEDEDGNHISDDIAEAKVGNILKGDIRQRLLVNRDKEVPLLCVYLNQKDVPSEDEGQGVSKVIFNFDEVINYVIQMPEKFDGVMVISGDRKIGIPTSYLVSVYLPERILTNEKRAMKLIDSLSEDEKKYLGSECLEYLNLVYFEGKNPKQIADERQIDPAKIGNALTKAYRRLSDIIRFNR